MDYAKGAMRGDSQQEGQNKQSSGGIMGTISDKFNSAMGGSKDGGKGEGTLDKS